MSKILIVQPFRMIQQAMASCLTPEHEVRVTDGLPAIEFVKDFNIVIIDSTAIDSLRDIASQLPATPVLVVDRGNAFAAGFPSAVETLHEPVTRDNLRSAVRRLVTGDQLGPASPRDEVKIAGPQSRSRAARNGAHKQTVHKDSPNVIELVEVVDEPQAVTDSN